MIGILDRIIRYDNWIGFDWMGWNGMGWDWIGWDGMGLLDIIFGWFFFFPTLMGPAARRGIPRRGVFLFVGFLRQIPQNGHKCPKKMISGPDFLKNDDIWSNFIKLDQIGPIKL